jgi:hypothetical protein
MGLPGILVVIGRAPDGLISLHRAGKVKRGGLWLQSSCKEGATVRRSQPVWERACPRTARATAGTCPAPGSARLVLRLPRTRPVCPRFPRSHGLLAHSVRVFYAADRVGRSPGPGVVPRERHGSFGLCASTRLWFQRTATRSGGRGGTVTVLRSRDFSRAA